MRIGLDATALPPRPVGAGRYIIHLVRALAELDCEHELVVFAQQHGRALIQGSEKPGAPGNGGSDLGRLRWVVLPDQAPARRLVWEQAGFPRLLDREGIHLLHSLHYTRPIFLPCQSVVTFHDMTVMLFPHLHTRARRLYFPAMIRYSARHAGALLAVSESTRQDAIRLLDLPPEKITTTPLGVTADFRPIADPVRRSEVRARCHLPERFCLYVGLVEPRKNLPMLLAAYARLARSGSPPPLVVAGRLGWHSETIFDQVESLGLKEKVLFTGYVSSEDLPIVYNLAEVFVYPSLYEGFGLPPLEALACGTPVITTNVSSMPEHVGDAGLLVPPQDEDALLEALRRVLHDPALREELAARGPRQAAQFTWKRTAQTTLQVYRTVLSRLPHR